MAISSTSTRGRTASLGSRLTAVAPAKEKMKAVPAANSTGFHGKRTLRA